MLVLVLNKNNKYTNQSNKYAISIKRVCQPKHQVRHINQKNMPTKTPSMPSQSKEYANQTLNTPSQSKETANQNTKYAISIKRIRQPKHQIRCLNQKNTPMWILVLNIDLRALSWGNYWCKFTHFLAYNLKFWKLRWRTKNDKLQVCIVITLQRNMICDINECEDRGSVRRPTKSLNNVANWPLFKDNVM